jgi:hypothetical protein
MVFEENSNIKSRGDPSGGGKFIEWTTCRGGQRDREK